MANDDVFQDDGSSQPPSSDSGTKVVLIIVGIVAVCFLLCCGGAVVLGWRFANMAQSFVENMVVSDPDKIREMTSKMIDIEIPEMFDPAQGMDMVAVRFVMYQLDADDGGESGMLMLMEMGTQQLGANPQQQEQALRQQMQQQQQYQTFKSKKSETREFEIRGEKVKFEFTEGILDDTPGSERKMHQVQGVFKGKRGPVMLQLMLPDDKYDDEEVTKMLQSIK
jgi:hypothetical protein